MGTASAFSRSWPFTEVEREHGEREAWYGKDNLAANCMRIAISGTHRSGKSTLVEELSAVLPGYLTVEEPYYLLVEEGYEFAEMPSVEDFELQLERSIECLNGSEPNVIFDRCPIDMLGYLLAHPDTEAFPLKRWLPRVQAAIENLDLIVFLPVEERDRIALPPSEDAGFRLDVDRKLKEILLDDSLELGMNVLEVTGPLHERVKQVASVVIKGSFPGLSPAP